MNEQLLRNDQLEAQRLRYNSEARAYLEHHGDPINQKYRDLFIRRMIFRFDLMNARVLDAMCASGTETGFLLKRGAVVTGLDISEENALLYRCLWNRECVVRSIHDSRFPSNWFDVVYVCGGLHHILPELGDAVAEIHRILKPEGRFCFMEPNADTLLNQARKLWYRLDPRFQPSEAAIDYRRQMRGLLDLGFVEEHLGYGGNVAYLFVSQSLVLRIPKFVKRAVHRPLFLLEDSLRYIPFAPRLFFAGVWRKTGTT